VVIASFLFYLFPFSRCELPDYGAERPKPRFFGGFGGGVFSRTAETENHAGLGVVCQHEGFVLLLFSNAIGHCFKKEIF
jgi:hypothetical protein